MIIDSETNFLYLADSLKKKEYSSFCERLENKLKENNISYTFLEKTNDIWCRDYMPIQITENKFVQFTYNPDYLRTKKGLKSKSDVNSICESIKIKTIKSDIVLDGGNVIKILDKVIMCDKVFPENPLYTRKQLSNKLRELFEIDNLYFLPQQPSDFTGHADGMVRFLDNNTVIINDYSKENNPSKENKYFQRAFKIALDNAKLDYKEIPYNLQGNKTYSQANGIYLNYLQMEKVVFVPTFGIKEDDIAVKQFEELFKGQTIATIDSNEIANNGGILNCITWNTKKERQNIR